VARRCQYLSGTDYPKGARGTDARQDLLQISTRRADTTRTTNGHNHFAINALQSRLARLHSVPPGRIDILDAGHPATVLKNQWALGRIFRTPGD
jgi:hypothetical protein